MVLCTGRHTCAMMMMMMMMVVVAPHDEGWHTLLAMGIMWFADTAKAVGQLHGSPPSCGGCSATGAAAQCSPPPF
jgi:hypothetical protein